MPADPRVLEAYSLVLRWTRQAERFEGLLRAPDFKAMIEDADQATMYDNAADIVFALVSMSGLRNAIALAAGLTSDADLDALLERFESELPTQKEARNLHLHLDRYIAQQGWNPGMQAGFDRLAGLRRPAQVMQTSELGHPFTSVRVLLAPDVELEMLSALQAAAAIGRDAKELIERHTN